MISTTAAARSIEDARRTLIGKLLLVGWIEQLTSEDGNMQPDTLATLTRLGATLQQQKAALDAIIDCADGVQQPFYWRRQPKPLGPLMQKAAAAWRQWEAQRHKEEAENTVQVGSRAIIIAEAAEVPLPVEPAPAPAEAEPIEVAPVEPPIVVERVEHRGIW